MLNLATVLVMLYGFTSINDADGVFKDKKYAMKPMRFIDDTCVSPNGCDKPSPEMIKKIRGAMRFQDIKLSEYIKNENRELKKIQNKPVTKSNKKAKVTTNRTKRIKITEGTKVTKNKRQHEGTHAMLKTVTPTQTQPQGFSATMRATDSGLTGSSTISSKTSTEGAAGFIQTNHVHKQIPYSKSSIGQVMEQVYSGESFEGDIPTKSTTEHTRQLSKSSHYTVHSKSSTRQTPNSFFAEGSLNPGIPKPVTKSVNDTNIFSTDNPQKTGLKLKTSSLSLSNIATLKDSSSTESTVTSTPGTGVTNSLETFNEDLETQFPGSHIAGLSTEVQSNVYQTTPSLPSTFLDMANRTPKSTSTRHQQATLANFDSFISREQPSSTFQLSSTTNKQTPNSRKKVTTNLITTREKIKTTLRSTKETSQSGVQNDKSSTYSNKLQTLEAKTKTIDALGSIHSGNGQEIKTTADMYTSTETSCMDDTETYTNAPVFYDTITTNTTNYSTPHSNYNFSSETHSANASKSIDPTNENVLPPSSTMLTTTVESNNSTDYRNSSRPEISNITKASQYGSILLSSVENAHVTPKTRIDYQEKTTMKMLEEQSYTTTAFNENNTNTALTSTEPSYNTTVTGADNTITIPISTKSSYSTTVFGRNITNTPLTSTGPGYIFNVMDKSKINTAPTSTIPRYSSTANNDENKTDLAPTTTRSSYSITALDEINISTALTSTEGSSSPNLVDKSNGKTVQMSTEQSHRSIVMDKINTNTVTTSTKPSYRTTVFGRNNTNTPLTSTGPRYSFNVMDKSKINTAPTSTIPRYSSTADNDENKTDLAPTTTRSSYSITALDEINISTALTSTESSSSPNVVDKSNVKTVQMSTEQSHRSIVVDKINTNTVTTSTKSSYRSNVMDENNTNTALTSIEPRYSFIDDKVKSNTNTVPTTTNFPLMTARPRFYTTGLNTNHVPKTPEMYEDSTVDTKKPIQNNEQVATKNKGCYLRNKVNCGSSGITEKDCKAKNCCFDNSTSTSSWCFEKSKPDECDAVKRVHCGYSNITSEKCRELSCCFDASTSGPWCYNKTNTEGCEMQHKNYCYELVDINGQHTLENAEKACTEKGGKLADMQNKDLVNVIVELLRQYHPEANDKNIWMTNTKTSIDQLNLGLVPSVPIPDEDLALCQMKTN